MEITNNMTDLDRKIETVFQIRERFIKGFPKGNWEVFGDPVHGMFTIINTLNWRDWDAIRAAGFIHFPHDKYQ